MEMKMNKHLLHCNCISWTRENQFSCWMDKGKKLRMKTNFDQFGRLVQLNKSVCRMWCYGPNSIKTNRTAPVNSIRINRFEWFSAIDLHRVYHSFKDPKAIPFHGKINLGPTNTFRFVRQVQWLNSIQSEFKCYLFRMKRQKIEISFVLLFRHLQMKW